MSKKVADTLVRDTLGKFAPKSEVPRKVRSVNLTDDAWQWLAAVAQKAGMSRNDYLEALAEGNSPFIETVNTKRENDEFSRLASLCCWRKNLIKPLRP
jgi:hypothetical protein